MRAKNLYWSHIYTMRQCPQKYLWSYGHPDFDLGNGKGKRKPLPSESERSSEHNKLMGSVLSKVVEDLYNENLWMKLNKSELANELVERAREEFYRLEQKMYCLWTYLTREEALNVCEEGARNVIHIMVDNRLLGEENKSELRMSPNVNKYVNVCGIADLVFKNHEGWHIYDGKNAMTPMKYENNDQLIWYALCFYLQYGEMPKSLGFFYFRYPKNNPPSTSGCDTEDWKGVVQVDFDLEDLKRLAKEAVETSKAIKYGNFEANPVPKQCNFCDYQFVCPERIAHREANASKRKRKPKKDAPPAEKGFKKITF